MPKLFISYRRQDAAAEAGRLSDLLRDEFGEDEVFIDVENIPPGERFQKVLENALMEAGCVLAVIGPRWVAIANADGRRRLEDPNDYVRREIAIAIQHKLRLIPVLVDGAAMPRPEELPEEICSLPDYQAFTIRQESFRRDAEALARKIAHRWHWRHRAAVVAGGALVLAIAGYLVLPRLIEPKPPHPSEFRLKVQVHLDDSLGVATGSPDMKLAHRKPKALGVNLLQGGTPMGAGTFEYESPLFMPDQGEQYLGLLHRVVTSGVLTSPRQADLCFVRGAKSIRKEPIVRLQCEEGGPCNVARDDFGWAKPCVPTAAGFSLFPVVYAQGSSPPPKVGWVVPSLETLQKQESAKSNPAFTEFVMESDPLPVLAKADRFSYFIDVNGTPLYFDGMPPDTNLAPFDAKVGVRLRFGLENLNFSGIENGYEHVDVRLRFFSGDTLLKESSLRMRCIALRALPEKLAGGANEFGIRWRVHYHRAPVDDKYQIFLLSTPAADAAMRQKRRIDAAKIKLGNDLIVGVVRPPLGTNATYGLVLGITLASGQVKFSFDDETSRRLCRALVQANVSASLLHPTAFRRNISNRNDSRACRAF